MKKKKEKNRKKKKKEQSKKKSGVNSLRTGSRSMIAHFLPHSSPFLYTIFFVCVFVCVCAQFTLCQLACVVHSMSFMSDFC